MKQIGFNAWLSEQFAASETPILIPGSNSNSDVQSQYLNRLASAPDQETTKVVGVSEAKAVTLLVGAPTSMVFRAVGVLIAGLVSKTIAAC